MNNLKFTSRVRKYLAPLHDRLLLAAKLTRAATPSVTARVLFYGGAFSIAYGFWLAWHPLGFIVGGAMGVWYGANIVAELEARNNARRDRGMRTAA